MPPSQGQSDRHGTPAQSPATDRVRNSEVTERAEPTMADLYEDTASISDSGAPIEIPQRRVLKTFPPSEYELCDFRGAGRMIAGEDSFNRIIFSPDGSKMISTGGSSPILWDLQAIRR